MFSAGSMEVQFIPFDEIIILKAPAPTATATNNPTFGDQQT
jgi:hypothetical protein